MSIAEVEARATLARAVEKPLVVLKFGSSVLRSSDDLPELVSEIYRAVRDGRRVIAVVSAFDGHTDALLEEAARFGCPHDNVNAAAYVALGEETSAALAALACDRAGLCAIALKASELGVIAEGPFEEANPIDLDARRLRQALEAHDVVIVPGFVARDTSGRTVLLGRGGSDLTAVFLAHRLGGEHVRLLKDVDGVYERDPATAPNARRYGEIDWTHAAAIAGRLVQTRALDFARANNVAIALGAIGEHQSTLIAARDGPPRARRARPRLRVALGGYGVVGAGVAARLLKRPEAFELVSVLVRDAGKARDGVLGAEFFTLDPRAALERADVVVDALSESDAGARLTELALTTGVHVVSANKQALVAKLRCFEAAAAQTGAQLAFSAAVGGAAPILETVHRAATASQGLRRVEAVLNGTVNYVLELLAEGASLEEAFARARRAGLAEEDPSADFDGHDAAAKLRLIAQTGFGVDLAAGELCVAKLDAAIAERGRRERLKQVSRLSLEGVTLRGEITFVAADVTPFSDLSGDRNAIVVESADGRVWSARGRGAGRGPTTESVFADLIELREMLCD